VTDDTTVKGTEFTTTQDYDPKVKATAYSMFLETDNTAEDIAVDLSIPVATIAKWIQKGKWRDQKKEIEATLMSAAEDDYRALVIKHRVPTMMRHLKVTTAIEEGVLSQVEEIFSGSSTLSLKDQTLLLKRCAETMSSSASVSGKAAGIEDKPLSGKDAGKRNLIMLNVTPTRSIDGEVEIHEIETPPPGS
jgi:transposase-like protein